MFAFHSEPETAVTLNGAGLKNQIALALEIAEALPDTHTLLVREHPRMFGLRPLRNYRSLQAQKNIYVDLGREPVHKVLQRTDAVVTIASTVGLQALAQGKPVLILGSCGYDSVAGVVRKKDFADLRSSILALLSSNWENQEIVRSLLSYVSGLIMAGAPVGWWSDVASLAGEYDFDQDGFVRLLDVLIEEFKQLILSD
jgi:hypothetical protein